MYTVSKVATASLWGVHIEMRLFFLCFICVSAVQSCLCFGSSEHTSVGIVFTTHEGHQWQAKQRWLYATQSVYHPSLLGQIRLGTHDQELNMGISIRQLVSDQAMFGLIGFIDVLRDHQAWSKAWTLGFEHLSPWLDCRLNAYGPLGHAKFDVPRVTKSGLLGTHGVYFGLDPSMDWHFYQMGYQWQWRLGYLWLHNQRLMPSQVHRFYSGLSVSANANRFQSRPWQPWTWLRQWTLKTEIDRDTLKSQWSIGLQWSYHRPKAMHSFTQESLLQRPVVRDEWIRQGRVKVSQDQAAILVNKLLDIAVINLDRDTDRLQTVSDWLHAQGLNFTRQPAVNGRALYPDSQAVLDAGLIVMDPKDPRLQQLNKSPKSYGLKNFLQKKFSPKTSFYYQLHEYGNVEESIAKGEIAANLPGHIGASMSHFQLLNRFKGSPKPYLLVLEDDAVPLKPDSLAVDLYQIMVESQRLSANFDVLWLGMNNSSLMIDPFCIEKTGRVNTVGAHAYLVKTKQLPHLIEKSAPPFVGLWDFWWNYPLSDVTVAALNQKPLFPRNLSTSMKEGSRTNEYQANGIKSDQGLIDQRA